MIENIIFGFDNIVCDIDYSNAEKAFSRQNIIGIESLYGPGIRKGLFDDFEKGKLNVYQFEDEFNTRMKTNLNLGDIDGLLRSHLQVNNDILELFLELGLLFNLYLVCNTNPLTMLWADSFEFSTQEYPLSLYFTKTYCSYKYGYSLPDWRFLDFIITDAGISPADSLLIDSNIKTLKAADGLGFSLFYPESKNDLKSYLRNLIRIRHDD